MAVILALDRRGFPKIAHPNPRRTKHLPTVTKRSRKIQLSAIA